MRSGVHQHSMDSIDSISSQESFRHIGKMAELLDVPACAHPQEAMRKAGHGAVNGTAQPTAVNGIAKGGRHGGLGAAPVSQPTGVDSRS